MHVVSYLEGKFFVNSEALPYHLKYHEEWVKNKTNKLGLSPSVKSMLNGGANTMSPPWMPPCNAMSLSKMHVKIEQLGLPFYVGRWKQISFAALLEKRIAEVYMESQTVNSCIQSLRNWQTVNSILLNTKIHARRIVIPVVWHASCFWRHSSIISPTIWHWLHWRPSLSVLFFTRSDDMVRFHHWQKAPLPSKKQHAH